MKLFAYSDNYHNVDSGIINQEYSYSPTLDFVKKKGYVCKNFKDDEDINLYVKNNKFNLEIFICHFKKYKDFIMNNIEFLKTYNCNKFIWIDDVHYHYNRKSTYQCQLQLNNLIKDFKNIYFFGSYMYVFNKITNMNIENEKLIQYYHGINNNELVNYNNNPKNKILLYGCHNKTWYPARFYLKNIKNKFIDILEYKDKIYGINLMNYISNKFSILLNENKIENLFEIGFRFPLLLKSYQDLKINVSGCDTVKSNILLGKYLNFNVELIDFNNTNDINNIKLKEKTLIISYHCFEHLENPLNSLYTLYKIMPNNSYLHIEVPLEPIKYPNTRYAHLQTFYKDDLKNMLEEVGFNFLNSFYDNKNERHLVSK
jgi:hypothetical protein